MLNYEFPPVGGGGGNATYNISKDLVRRGYEVYILTSQYKHQKRLETKEGIHIYRVPTGRKRIDYCSKREMFNFIVFALPKAKEIIKEEKIDLVHTYFGIPSGVVSYFMKKLYKTPYIIRMGGSDVPGFNKYRFKKTMPLIKPALIRIWKYADALVAVSEGLKKLAEKTCKDVNIEVIPNGVDLEKFKIVGNGFKSNGSVKLLTVGRYDSSRKGVDVLIKAAKLMNKLNGVKYEIMVIGDGPYRKKFQQLAKYEKVKNINFLGYIPNTELFKYYNMADIYVLPSYAEGMSNTILEAMATGLPVVATNVGGNPENITPKKNGYLVRVGDHINLAKHLYKLISDEKLRKKMGKKSLETIRKDYSWKQITDKYINLYNRVLSS